MDESQAYIVVGAKISPDMHSAIIEYRRTSGADSMSSALRDLLAVGLAEVAHDDQAIRRTHIENARASALRRMRTIVKVMAEKSIDLFDTPGLFAEEELEDQT